MNILFIDSVFNMGVALYNRATDTVTINNQSYTYDKYDEEFIVANIYHIDEYNFLCEMSELRFAENTYNLDLEEYYNPAPEYCF